MKLIDEDSLAKLQEVMHHILQYKAGNVQSGLIDIYRIFVISSHKQQYDQVDVFILMPCLRSNFEDILAIYDIKGHTDTRSLDIEDYKVFKFGKDENFIQSK